MHPAGFRRLAKAVACGVREQNVPCGHLAGSCVTQSGGNRLSRFSKTDESNCRLAVSHCRIPFAATNDGRFDIYRAMQPIVRRRGPAGRRLL